MNLAEPHADVENMGIQMGMKKKRGRPRESCKHSRRFCTGRERNGVNESNRGINLSSTDMYLF